MRRENTWTRAKKPGSPSLRPTAVREGRERLALSERRVPEAEPAQPSLGTVGVHENRMNPDEGRAEEAPLGQVHVRRGNCLCNARPQRLNHALPKDYSGAGSAEAAASTDRFANHRFRNGFSMNKARSAEIESNTIAMLKTPDHPIFGSTIFAENGIGISVTVR